MITKLVKTGCTKEGLGLTKEHVAVIMMVGEFVLGTLMDRSRYRACSCKNVGCTVKNYNYFYCIEIQIEVLKCRCTTEICNLRSNVLSKGSFG